MKELQSDNLRMIENEKMCVREITCGQSYKASKSVNYDSRVVLATKLLTFNDSRLVNYDRRGFIRLAT